MADASQDQKIESVASIAHIPASLARHYLEASNWDVDGALTIYYGAAERVDEVEPSPALPSAGASASASAGANRPPQRKAAPRKKFATLRDVQQGGDDDSDPAGDEEDEEIPQDFYAGGGKSGLAVQDPDDLKKKIIEKAMQTPSSGPGEEEAPKKKSHFTGSARTLGGDDAPSRVIENPGTKPAPARSERVHRTLHFWKDGFSVDDGELYNTSEPRNAAILDLIRRGRAPLHIMNVEQDQEVEVEVKEHLTNYEKPKPKFRPFSGQGRRLGSPTPAPGGPANPPAPSGAPAAAAAPAGSPRPAIDESQPSIAFQIRLGDGTRLVSRFNTTHTVQDLYDFVSAAMPANETRRWVIMTTFPSKELKDKSIALGELEGYKRGGVVVQKWV